MALTPEQEERAVSLAFAGWPVKEIRDYLGCRPYEFWEHQQANPAFAAKFAGARKAALEDMADKLLNVVDEFADVQKARLQSDNIKWTLAKRIPEQFGDKLDINVNAAVSITSALTEAKARLLPSQQAEQQHLIDITPQSDTGSADTQSSDHAVDKDA